MKHIFTEEEFKKNKKQSQLWDGEEFVKNPFFKVSKSKLAKETRRQQYLSQERDFTQDEIDEIQNNLFKRLSLAL